MLPENFFRLNGFYLKKVGLISCCMPAACRHLIFKVYTMRPMLVLHLKTQKQCITDLQEHAAFIILPISGLFIYRLRIGGVIGSHHRKTLNLAVHAQLLAHQLHKAY